MQLSEPQSILPHLSAEADHLLREAALSSDGIIGNFSYSGGAIVQTNGKNFVEPNNPRSRAVWEAAIRELYTLGFIERVGSRGEAYRITKSGYELADALKGG